MKILVTFQAHKCEIMCPVDMGRCSRNVQQNTKIFITCKVGLHTGARAGGLSLHNHAVTTSAYFNGN